MANKKKQKTPLQHILKIFVVLMLIVLVLSSLLALGALFQG